MINCYKELLALSPSESYFIAFTFIRQIGVHLKMGFREKSQENIFMIYNWQYLNQIKLWSKCLEIEELAQLSYPLVQVVTGILSLYWTDQWFPFYIHLLQILNRFQNQQHIVINTWKYQFYIQINYQNVVVLKFQTKKT